MKSTEVYKQINLLVRPDLKRIGFLKAKSGMLGFYKEVNGKYLLFWFQCSQNGFEQYTGSKFTIEFQVSESPVIGSESLERSRIAGFMTTEELVVATKAENAYRKNLKKPPKDYHILQISEDVRTWYLKQFEQAKDYYTCRSDIWFSYHDEKDVDSAIAFVRPIIGRILANLESKYT